MQQRKRPVSSAAQKEGLLAKVRQEIAKKHGTDAIVDFHLPAPIEAISTGHVLVDWATGIGGLPRGRIVELYGRQASGKTTLALSTAATCQRLGDAVLYLDYEHSFDFDYAHRIGLAPEDETSFILSKPETLEQGMEIAETVLTAAAVGVIIVDSLAAMLPRKELEAEVGDQTIALQARAIGQEMRRLIPLVGNSRTCMIFINHLRDVIGGFNPTGQVRTSTPGGSWLKYGASLRLALARTKTIPGKVRDPLTGQIVNGVIATQHEVKVEKNKLAPLRKGLFYLELGQLHGEVRLLVDLGIAWGLIHKTAALYSMPGEFESVRGKEAVFDLLRDRPGLVTQLRDAIMDRITNLTLPQTDDDSQPQDD